MITEDSRAGTPRIFRDHETGVGPQLPVRPGVRRGRTRPGTSRSATEEAGLGTGTSRSATEEAGLGAGTSRSATEEAGLGAGTSRSATEEAGLDTGTSRSASEEAGLGVGWVVPGSRIALRAGRVGQMVEKVINGDHAI